ncbi:MAG: hypothetical protein IKU29_01915, partial [Parabacteroides sp.]|nr:hypothetical protein [Parabacteroides sp.]
YDKSKRTFSISYIKENGHKALLNFNVDKFKAFYKTPTGNYMNWDGAKCRAKWTDNPSNFEFRTFIEELDPKTKALLNIKTNPVLYTFDIETEISDEFPDPAQAKFPITAISVANTNCDVMVLGTKELDVSESEWCQEMMTKYLNESSYWKSLNLPAPKFTYLHFQSEQEMLRYFLTKIVSKVPVIAGWNSLMFDWQYIQNRIRGYYPDLGLKCCSVNETMSQRRCEDMKGDKVILNIPNHTLVLDMMDVIGTFDLVVMPIKESLSLDYIASESIGMHKIKYDGSLQDLFENDYKRYVFYNAVDSVLVQLLDKKFKTFGTICAQSMVCREKIGSCFSKIAIAEALFWNYFYENGIKVVYEKQDRERGTLQGAYVKNPIPGKHSYVCCNDFSGLYPAVVITCNISVENYIGQVTDEEELSIYKNDPNYFVSVEGHVFKNDKDYAFKNIQMNLRKNRNVSKYLSKQLDAIVMKDIESIKSNHQPSSNDYPQNIQDALIGIGFNVKNASDITSVDIIDFEAKLRNEITHLSSIEQAYKLCGNSCYGGSSHVSFFWFLMPLASTITAEARNLIHKMEHHIPEHFRLNWENMTDLHDKLGIKLKPKNELQKILAETPVQLDDTDAYHNHSYVVPVYGDSCIGSTKISTTKGDITIEDLFNMSTTVYYDRGKYFAKSDLTILNYNGNRIIESPIKYVIRHLTNKTRWRITDSESNQVEVTGDHSMIILKNGEMRTVKPSQMIEKSILITTRGLTTVEKIEQLNDFEEEYVYDIEVLTDNDNEHNFFGNHILIHNTDSITGDSIINTEHGDITIEDLYNDNSSLKFNMTDKHGSEFVGCTDKVLNWSEKNNLYYGEVKYIMRHKVSKPKWRLKSVSGEEIIVTGDHSLIVFRDGIKMEVKPKDVLKTDKILVVKR